MALNKVVKPLPVVEYSHTTTKTVDLEQGMYTQYLLLVVKGTIDVAAGGGVAGTALADGVARLIRQFTVKWDQFPLVDQLSGRDIAHISRGAVARVGGFIPYISVQDGSVQTKAFAAAFVIPCARPWNVKPSETSWPIFPVASQLRAYIDWEAGVATAGDDPGSAAFYSGGSRAVTFTSAPTLSIYQIGTLTGKKPWYISTYSALDSEQFTAANSQFKVQLVNRRKWDAAFVRVEEGGTRQPADLLNKFTFAGGGTRFYDAVDAQAMRALDLYGGRGMFADSILFDMAITHTREVFSAGSTALPALQGVGEFAIMPHDGWLNAAVEPLDVTNPRFEYDIATPGTAPGIIRHVFSELLTHPALTEKQDAPM